MTELLLIIIVELIILYFLSQKLTQILYSICFTIFKNKHTVYGIITFIYLPGIAVHELAHLIMAEILRVPTGELSFTPQFEKNQSGQEELKAGSLKIGNSDPLRRYLIGFAPVIIGLMVLVLLIWLFQHFWPARIALPETAVSLQAGTQSVAGGLQMNSLKYQVGLITLIGYLIFAISNNMFSSKKDLEGFLIFLPVIVLIISATYFAGLRISLTGTALDTAQMLLIGLTKALGIVMLINIIILSLSSLVIFLLRRIIRL